MQITFSIIIVGSVFVLGLAIWVWKIVNWVWFNPRKMERHLRQQGLKGNPYRFLFGDIKENTAMLNEAKSKPMNLTDHISPRVSPFIYKIVQEYGKNVFTWRGPVPRVVIMKPHQIKEVFNKMNDYQKTTIHPLAKLLSFGLANLEGEKWAKHRKIINPTFHQEKLKHMVPAFHESCNEIVDKWKEMVEADGWCELDVWPFLANLTSDVISRTAFGSSYEEGKRIFQLQDKLAQLTMKLFQSLYIPGWRFLPTKHNKKMKSIDKEIRASLKGIIEKREKAINDGEPPKDDLLGILLESNAKEIKEHGNNKNLVMSINDVIEECKLFYFAGQETTSVLLVWTMVLLARHPYWQSRAREEVLAVFGDRKPEFEGLNNLKVVTMILNEVLRLYGPVVILSRKTTKDISLGDLSLLAGTEILLPTTVIHHDQELWGDDASEFKPERFGDGISKATNNQVCYFPFGWGPRICIGQNFSLAEAKIAMTLILQNFSFELSPSYTHAPFMVVTLRPQHGAHLILHKI